jgi:serine/threonine protein kinase
VWAFGCVLYECLTGRRAFDGESMADVLAAVVHEEANFARLPPSTPAYLIALLERCLEKDTRRRLRDIGEARVALTSEVAASASSIQRRGVPVARPRTFPITIAGVLAGLVVGWGAARMGWLSSADERDDGGPSHLGATRFTVQTAGSQPLGGSWPVALSPDGRTLAYSVGFEASASAFLLDFTEFEARPLEGGEG